MRNNKKDGAKDFLDVAHGYHEDYMETLDRSYLMNEYNAILTSIAISIIEIRDELRRWNNGKVE